MPKIAILYTTPVTVEPLRALAAELLPGVQVVNFVDDSILPQLVETSGLRAVEPRLVQYAPFAEEVGAEAILSACSSVGELSGLPAEQQEKFLTSPRSGMERLRQVLEPAPERI